jgi:alginate O-acetyltransferase complex protein AlgI
MLLGGLWHGANLTFVIWGAWHGFWLAFEKKFRVGKGDGFNVISWLFTMLLIVLGWVMFRSETVTQAYVFYEAMFNFSHPVFFKVVVTIDRFKRPVFLTL